MHITLNMYVWGRAARKRCAETARAFGQCNKIYDDSNVTVSRQFSEQITVAVFAPRAKVCRRVVMGARILPARIVPATKEVRIPPPGLRSSNGNAILLSDSRLTILPPDIRFGPLKIVCPFLAHLALLA